MNVIDEELKHISITAIQGIGQNYNLSCIRNTVSNLYDLIRKLDMDVDYLLMKQKEGK